MALVKTVTADVENDDNFLFESNESSDFVICKSPGKLKILLDAISPGKHVHYASDGDWSAHDLVIELVKKIKPVELWISTYAIREFGMRQLILAMDRGDITRLNMLVDNRVKSQSPDVYHLAKENANSFTSSMVHGKATVLQGPNGCVTIMGSQNFTGNPRLEFGVVTTEPGAAAFYIHCIKNGIEHGKIFE